MTSSKGDCGGSGMKKLVLFDVDGTLTLPRNPINEDMVAALGRLSASGHYVGVVGGSDLAKIAEQLCMKPDQLKSAFDFVFAENGLIAFKKLKNNTDAHEMYQELSQSSMVEKIGEEKMQEVLNFCLGYLSKLTLPCKRGTFIEYRRGMLNVSPIGRACSQAERDAFFLYDKEKGVRSDMVAELEEKFANSGLKFSIGGQISIDIFPVGWDKTYCLQFVAPEKFDEIHFVGDRTSPGGNDYEIFSDNRTIGHSVTCPQDTIELISKLMAEIN